MHVEGSYLEGVRILDFTVNAAGPNSTWLLSSLGADVIKVEAHTRPDPTRGFRDRPYLHAILYEDLNPGKRSITLDMKSAAAQKLALELAGRCDALVDSFRPGVMDRFGLGFEEVHSRYPHVVVASLSATGSAGPLAGLPGYAGVFNALGGLGGLTGYAGGPPTDLRIPIDLRSGAMYAMTVMWAISEARRTGVGSRVDFSATEAVAMLCGDYLVGALLGAGKTDQRIGNRDDYWAPCGVYPTADAKWVALGVRNDAEWASLARLMEGDQAQVPDYLADGGARRAAEPDVDDLVARWTAGRDAAKLIELLRAAGLPASDVADARDLFYDEHLRSTGFFQTVKDLETGSEQVALSAPWLANGQRPRVGIPRRLGEDNYAVLTELLGLSDDEIAELEDDGTLSRPSEGTGTNSE